MRFPRSLIPMLVLAGCVPAPVVTPPPVTPTVSAPPPPEPAVGWREQAFAAGAWTYRAEAAAFGVAGAEPELTLRCDRSNRRVIVSRRGTATGGALTLLATSRQQAFQAAVAGTRTEAAIPATDAMLDRFVTSRGRMGVAATGLPTLVVPTWAEPIRVVEDCRG